MNKRLSHVINSKRFSSARQMKLENYLEDIYIDPDTNDERRVDLNKPITKVEKQIVKRIFSERKRILSELLECIKDEVVSIRLMYNMDGIGLDHFEKWFNPDFWIENSVYLKNKHLIIRFGLDKIGKIKSLAGQAKFISVCNELLKILNEDGLEEFFPTIYTEFCIKTVCRTDGHKLAKEIALENARRDNTRAREISIQREKMRYQNMVKDDYKAIRDTSISTHCNIGKL